MKRKVAGVLAAAMAAGMLAGCGSSAKPADTTAAKAEDTKAAEGSTEAAAADNGDKITIEFWHCMVHPPVLSTPDIASCAAL